MPASTRRTIGRGARHDGHGRTSPERTGDLNPPRKPRPYGAPWGAVLHVARRLECGAGALARDPLHQSTRPQIRMVSDNLNKRPGAGKLLPVT